MANSRDAPSETHRLRLLTVNSVLRVVWQNIETPWVHLSVQQVFSLASFQFENEIHVFSLKVRYTVSVQKRFFFLTVADLWLCCPWFVVDFYKTLLTHLTFWMMPLYHHKILERYERYRVHLIYKLKAPAYTAFVRIKHSHFWWRHHCIKQTDGKIRISVVHMWYH